MGPRSSLARAAILFTPERRKAQRGSHRQPGEEQALTARHAQIDHGGKNGANSTHAVAALKVRYTNFRHAGVAPLMGCITADSERNAAPGTDHLKSAPERK